MFTLEEVIGFLTLAHIDAEKRGFYLEGSIPAERVRHRPNGTNEFVYRRFGFSMTLTVKPSDSGTVTSYTMQWKRVSDKNFNTYNDGIGNITTANAAMYNDVLWWVDPVC